MLAEYSKMKVYWIILFIGYVRPDKFRLIKLNKSWNESRKLCINHGMDLAVISDNDVMTEVRKYIKTELGMYRFNEDIWIGLTWSKVCASFLWLNKQQLAWPDEQQPWASNEPDCYIELCDQQTAKQTCVRMKRDYSLEWKWRTHACFERHYAICQNLSSPTRDVSSTPESVTINCSSTVNSTTIDSTTTTESVTTIVSTAITTSSQTTMKSDVTATSPDSTKRQSQTQLTTNSATTILSASSKLISTMKSTELPRIVTTEFITTKMESSFNASTEYITNGTFFNNCTRKCICKSVSIEMNTPQDNYRIDKRQTSAYIRRHSSAYDGRLSSRIIGYTGAAVICTVVLIVISFDIINLMKRNEANK